VPAFDLAAGLDRVVIARLPPLADEVVRIVVLGLDDPLAEHEVLERGQIHPAVPASLERLQQLRRGVADRVQEHDLRPLLFANPYLFGRELPFPVLALDVMRGLKLAQHGFRIDRTDMRVIDRLQRIEHFGALRGRQQRRMLGDGVRVRRDIAEQRRAERARLGEVLDVAVVERVERTVHHGDLPAILPEISVSDDHVSLKRRPTRFTFRRRSRAE
jgi:hypothetical protein